MSFICLFLTFSMILYLGKLVRPTDTDDDFLAIRTFHELPEDSVDVIVYGSIHAWKGINVKKMYEDYGIGAYNYATNWQKINTSALFLHDSLRTQSPKIALIETVFVDDPKMDSDLDGEIYYTKAIPYSSDKAAYLKQCFGDHLGRYVSYYLPLVAFHENRENLTEYSFREGLQWYFDFKSTMGFRSSDIINPVVLTDWTSFEQKPLSEEAMNILNDIVKTCHESGTDVVFYTAPYEGEYCYGDAMAQYASENGCSYIDFFKLVDELGIDPDSDFQDAGHLNTSGSTKLAAYMGTYLHEHFELPDRRLQEDNIWEVGF